MPTIYLNKNRYKRFAFRLLPAAFGFATLLSASQTARAEAFYIAQTSQGSGTGADAADTLPVSFFNTKANWSSPVKVSFKIGPGDTVHLVGAIETGLVFQEGGTKSLGLVGTGPITMIFEPGALMVSPAWPNPNNVTGAITVPHLLGAGLGFIVIDGGTNGKIENTANGTLLANQINSLGIVFIDAHDSTVRNLAVENLYVRTGPNGDQNSFGIGVKIVAQGGSNLVQNNLVTNCVFHDEFAGLYIAYGAGWTNMEYSFCTAYNCNWCGCAGDASATATLVGLTVHDNDFHDFSNWDDNSGSDSHHHNGFYGWAVSGGSLRNVSYYNNIIGPNFGGYASSGIFDSGNIGGILVYNNIFLENGANDRPDDGLLFLNPNLGGTGSGFRIFNNTFVGAGKGTAINLSGGYGEYATVYDVVNNIASGVATFIAVYYNADSTLVSDYNLLYNLNVSQCLTTSPTSSSHFHSLANWQALGYDLHSSILNPNLNGSFEPQLPSGAIGTGMNLAGYFTDDFYGATRPMKSSWDIGACTN